MGAHVIPFPRLLDAPVVQAPRRGRLPNGIGSLRAVRMKRMREVAEKEEQRASDARSVWRALRVLEDDAASLGWLGFVLVALDDKGNAHGRLAGRCTDDPGATRRLAGWLQRCV